MDGAPLEDLGALVRPLLVIRSGADLRWRGVILPPAIVSGDRQNPGESNPFLETPRDLEMRTCGWSLLRQGEG